MDEQTPSPEAWARLAREVKRRRVQLELTQQQVASEGGPSVSILTRIETAKQTSYQDMALARLERALQWEPGSIAAILAGGTPTPTAQASPREAPPRSPSEIALEKLIAERLAAHTAALQQEVENLREDVRNLQEKLHSYSGERPDRGRKGA